MALVFPKGYAFRLDPDLHPVGETVLREGRYVGRCSRITGELLPGDAFPRCPEDGDACRYRRLS